MNKFGDQQKLDAVRASPEAVARHDKASWLGLFSGTAEVNDPEGSKAHVGKDSISRFYDTFIAPNQIKFLPDHDVVSDDWVIRDLVISTTMASGLQVDVSTHIRYQLVEQGGELKVQELHAHWELLPMVLQTLGKGLDGWVTYTKLTGHMLRCQGLGGMLGFMRGFVGAGKSEKNIAERILAAVRTGDTNTLAVHALNEAAMPDLQWRKVIAAGRFVTATVEASEQRGVALFEFEGKLVKQLRFFW